MKRLALVLVGILLGIAAPTAARTVVDFARNAGRVNGFRAVDHKASQSERAGKLVATDENGVLPSFIVQAVNTAESAGNSAKLGGVEAKAFQLRCTLGTLFGYAQVPGDTPQSATEVEGFSCFGGRPSVEHPAPGVYLVSMTFRTTTPCQPGQTTTIPAILTVNDARALVATYETVCSATPGVPVQRVQVRDTTGTPTDANFTILVPHWVGAPVTP